jgi:hypothetical protein
MRVKNEDRIGVRGGPRFETRERRGNHFCFAIDKFKAGPAPRTEAWRISGTRVLVQPEMERGRYPG